MIEYLHKFERIVASTLIVILVVMFFLTLTERGWILIQYLLKQPLFIFEIRELLEIFAFVSSCSSFLNCEITSNVIIL